MKTFEIKLAELATPRDVCYIAEMERCKYYTYTFQSDNEVIKHGKAADSEWISGTWGNRIYRQTGGIPGWGGWSLDDTSARKMRDGMSRHFPNLTKNDITIIVYDYTAELDKEGDIEIDRVLLNEEHELINQHVQLYGVAPKLNIQKTRVRTKAKMDLFEFI